MEFHLGLRWAQGEGISLTPNDDAGSKQPYPLRKVTLRSPGGMELASTVTSVPVSQELLCPRCRASGSSPYDNPTRTACYTCHGRMADVGDPQRVGWLDLQNCLDCRLCHSAEDRGTVHSEAKIGRTYVTSLGTKAVFKGQRIRCYTCHDGPDDDDAPSDHSPLAANRTLATPMNVLLLIAFTGADQDGDASTYRIIDQPAPGAFGHLSNGTVGLNGLIATFYPAEVQGAAVLTYAASGGGIEVTIP